jgi:pimeloyl-ACP methyl ester carboxylesterase
MAGALEPAVASTKYLHAQIAGSTMVIFPEAGHSPQVERPDLFNAALREHLARNAGR